MGHCVRIREQRNDGIAQLGVLEVDGDGSLACLSRPEATGETAQLIAGKSLDLDDIGAEVGKQSRGVRTGVVGPEVDDTETVEQWPRV